MAVRCSANDAGIGADCCACRWLCATFDTDIDIEIALFCGSELIIAISADTGVSIERGKRGGNVLQQCGTAQQQKYRSELDVAASLPDLTARIW